MMRKNRPETTRPQSQRRSSSGQYPISKPHYRTLQVGTLVVARRQQRYRATLRDAMPQMSHRCVLAPLRVLSSDLIVLKLFIMFYPLEIPQHQT